MSTKEKDSYENFVNLHRMQLAFSGVPELFWPTLFAKLKDEIFDAGDYFSMVCQEDDDDEFVDELSDETNQENMSNSSNEPPKKKISSVNTDEIVNITSPGSFAKSSRFSWKQANDEKWKVTVSHEDGLDANDPNCIFLIDHAWTYVANEARKHLLHAPSLLSRMCSLMDIDEEEGLNRDEQMEVVLKRMWRYNQTYSIQAPDSTAEDKLPVWYIMDEFGSRIGHSEAPNVRSVPFYYVPQGISYTLMFPVKNSAMGDMVTRDYVEGALYHRPEWRKFYMLPWSFSDYCHLPFDFIIPEDSFFTQDRHNEHLPVSVLSTPPGNKMEKLKVYTESSQVSQFLKHPRFEFVGTMEDADVLWLYAHFKDYKPLLEVRPHVMISQIPFESVLTVKDLLSAVVHTWYTKHMISNGSPPAIDPKSLESQPHWFATTYNLRTELPQFVSYFQNRDKLGLDNHWIIKPWNLARGLDTTVSSDLSQIIRLIGSGPKIACKYVEDPVLFHRDDISEWVKFDMRFIVLLRSVKPMLLYIYDRFWLRFALKQFSMDNLDDCEKHFTVFNYSDSSKIKQMFCNDYIRQFESQYPNYKWNDVQDRIYDSIRELFKIVCNESPPRGLASYPQCRAMYGVDVMLKWSAGENSEKVIQPIILEANFMPDCTRACEYYPDFMDCVFETLFLEKVSTELPVKIL